MDNLSLVTQVLNNPKSTPTELELADRLRSAIDEIDMLVRERAPTSAAEASDEEWECMN